MLPPSPQLPPSPRVGAPEIKAEENLEANAKIPTQNVMKREHGLMNDDNDDSGLFAASSSQGPAPKKQRLSQAAPRPRAAAKAKVAVKAEDDDRPEPRGQPEVWAEVPRLRTLPYARLADCFFRCDKRCASRSLTINHIIRVPILGEAQTAGLVTLTALFWTMTMMNMDIWMRNP